MPPNALTTELRKLWQELDLAKKEIRRLRTWQNRVGSGSGLRAGTIVGVVPVGSGGTGGTAGGAGSVDSWVNGDGTATTEGMVVVAPAGGNNMYKTTTRGHWQTIGVVIDASVAAGAVGRVRHAGYTAKVAVLGSVSAGRYLRSSSTLGLSEDTGSYYPIEGTYAIALTNDAAGFVEAFLFGFAYDAPDQIQFITGPVLPAIGTFSSQVLPDILTGFVGQVQVPFQLENSDPIYCDYEVTIPAVGAGAVIRAALHTEYGDLVAEGVDAVGTNTGVRRIQMATVPAGGAGKNSGLMWLFICLQSAAAVSQPSVKFWDTDDTFNAVAGAPGTSQGLCGTLVIIGGAAPGSFDPWSGGDLTPTPNCTPYMRLTMY